MRFLTGIALLFYVLIISIMAGATILFVTHVVLLDDINRYLSVVYDDSHVRMVAGGVSAALMILSFMFARIISGGRQKERTIAFDNPSGRVSVSLSAVEDLIKRLMYKLSEIKEARLHIIATKRGIEADARLTLKADVSIPDITTRLQELIQGKIQEILGIEEPVTVRVHIIKISLEESKSKRDKEEDGKTEPAPVPFQGYRR